MNRLYELGFIISNSVTEHDTAAVTETVKGVITDLGGQIVKVDNWGRRRMAYLINDMREGYYVFVTMTLDTGKITELERVLKLNAQVLRHLVVRLEEEDAEKSAAADASATPASATQESATQESAAAAPAAEAAVEEEAVVEAEAVVETESAVEPAAEVAAEPAAEPADDVPAATPDEPAE